MQIRYVCHHFGSAQKSLFRNIKNVFHSLEQPGVHLSKDDAPPHEAWALLQSAVSLLTNCISHFIHSTKNFLLPPIERFTTSMTNLNLCNSYPISACADLWAGLWPLYCVRVHVRHVWWGSADRVGSISDSPRTSELARAADVDPAAQMRGIHVNLITRTSWILMNLS